MTFRMSDGFRDAWLDYKARVKHSVIATTISFGDGDGTEGRDTINDSANGLAGFSATDMVTINGSTSNNITSEMLSVAAGKIEVAAGTLTTEAAGDTVAVMSARGGCFSDLLKFGIIKVFNGTQPDSANDAETGTHLATITNASLAFTSGVETNGLMLGNVSSHALQIETGQTWSAKGIAAGTAGWARFYANTVVSGASTSALRFDMAVSTSGGQFNMSNTTVAVNGNVTVDSVVITLPAA